MVNLKHPFKNKNGKLLPCPSTQASCAERYYVYVDRIMLHEFGHTLGLHDFYNDPTMDDLDAVMNTSYVIHAEDIKQLEAIYLLHNPH